LTHFISKAPQDIVCVDTLNDNPLAIVVCDLDEAGIDSEEDATRRSDSLELDI
jgi:hypothetical protein